MFWDTGTSSQVLSYDTPGYDIRHLLIKNNIWAKIHIL